MSESRFTFVFILALVMGAAATYGVYKFINAQRLAAAQLGRVDTAAVVVLKSDVAEGAAIEKRDVKISYFPADAVPEGSYAELDSVILRVARAHLYRGEPVIEYKLAALGAQPGIEVKIARGYRGMAVRVSDIVGVTGLIRPDARVDVLVTMHVDRSGRQQAIGKIILQNMRVLSVGTQTERGDPSKPIISSAVTLEVTPTEAEVLAVAQSQGSLSLALRSYGDPETPATTGATVDQVLAGIPILQPKPRRARPRPRPQPVAPETEPTTRTVEIYRAGRRSEEEVERDSLANGNGQRQN